MDSVARGFIEPRRGTNKSRPFALGKEVLGIHNIINPSNSGFSPGNRERAGLDGWHADLSWGPRLVDGWFPVGAGRGRRVACGSELDGSSELAPAGPDGWHADRRWGCIRLGGLAGPDAWYGSELGARGATQILAKAGGLG